MVNWYLSDHVRLEAAYGYGSLNRFVNAFLNDVDIRHLDSLDTPVGDGDTLVLLPAMAGG